MPHRFITGPCEIIFAAIFSIFAAAAGGIDELETHAIWDKGQLRIWCILGSIGGALLAIAIFTPRDDGGNHARRLATKFVASGIAGLLFTPIIIRWQGWPVDADVVLAVSGAVALMSVSVIHRVVPLLIKRAVAKVGDDTPEPPKAP